MKYFSYLIFFVSVYCYASENQFVVQAQKTAKTPIGMVFAGKKTKKHKDILERLQKDLQYSGQCHISIKYTSDATSLKDVYTLFSKDIYLLIYLGRNNEEYEWRLYDVLAREMIVSQKIKEQQLKPSLIAHMIADQIWPNLMGSKSSFNSKIAYCKQIWKLKNGLMKPYKQIWVSDFDGSNPRLFIDVPTVSLAPRWSMQPSCPLLFYSENTLSNVQLVMSNMFKNRHVMCSFDGLNMQPTFSQNGKDVVFCLSKDGSSQLYHAYVDNLTKKRLCNRLTHNEGNNIAPCFIDENHVAFVSDFQTAKPQIYTINLITKRIRQITDGAYCACPSYCFANNKLVYSKMIDGTMQLCLYDFKTQEHKQLTTGYGNKEEPSWSVCGNYITFGLQEGLKNRIAQLYIPTHKINMITSVDEHCTYPSCSPIYDTHIGILNS